MLKRALASHTRSSLISVPGNLGEILNQQVKSRCLFHSKSGSITQKPTLSPGFHIHTRIPAGSALSGF